MPPQFQTETQAKVYAKVAEILKDQFGAQARANDQAPQFNIRAGSAYVTVVVSPINDKSSVVRAYSWVVTGAESTTELRQFLLEQNFNMRFGAYALEPGTGDILFTHAVLGEGIDADELALARGEPQPVAGEHRSAPGVVVGQPHRPADRAGEGGLERTAAQPDQPIAPVVSRPQHCVVAPKRGSRRCPCRGRSRARPPARSRNQRADVRGRNRSGARCRR